MICRKLYCAVEAARWFGSSYVLWIIFSFFTSCWFPAPPTASHGLPRPDPYETIIRLNPPCLCCDGSDSSASVSPSVRSRQVSVLPALRSSSFLLCFSALVCRRCLAEPLLLLLSIFTVSQFNFHLSPPNVVVLPPSSGFLSPPHPLSSRFFLLQDQTGLSCRTCWLTCGTLRTSPPCSRL